MPAGTEPLPEDGVPWSCPAQRSQSASIRSRPAVREGRSSPAAGRARCSATTSLPGTRLRTAPPSSPAEKLGVEEAAKDLGRIACHQPRERVEQEPICLLLGQQGDRPAIELENGNALVIEGEIVETDLAAELGQHAPHRAHARHFSTSCSTAAGLQRPFEKSGRG